MINSRRLLRVISIVPQKVHARKFNIRYIKAQNPCPETHDERNLRIGRPLSPHLKIYKMQWNTTTSILNRLTGIALSGMVTLFAVGTLAMNDNFETFLARMREQGIKNCCLCVGKAIVAFPFAFHAVSGIRHLIWDSGKMLTNKSVIHSSYGVVVGSALFAVGLALL